MKYLFSFAITFLFILFFAGASVFAQEESQITPSVTVAPTSGPVGYTLPYPGLMPGDTFYFVKAMRDRVMSFLISSPLKKANFSLSQADKHIAASLLVIDHNKDDVDKASEMFSNGEKYYEESVRKIAEAKKQGMATEDIENRMELALLKYKEVMTQIENSITEKNREKFKIQKARLNDLQKNADQIVK